MGASDVRAESRRGGANTEDCVLLRDVVSPSGAGRSEANEPTDMLIRIAQHDGASRRLRRAILLCRRRP